MGFKKVDGYSWLIGLFMGLVIFLLLSSIGFPYAHHLSSVGGPMMGVFCLDAVTYYLVILSVFLSLSLLFFSGWVGGVPVFYVRVSLVFSVLCYACVHAFWF